MLVFGDASRRQAPRAQLPALDDMARQVAAMPHGIARHAALVTLFIALSELAQGISDAGFAARGGRDRLTPDAAMTPLLRLSEAIRRSWDSGFAKMPALPRIALPAPLPDSVESRRCEGFAFYALYPEAHLQAAAASGLGPGTRVIGLRSIGLPLAAMVASGLGAQTPPVTLRPVGHPFARRIALDTAEAAALAQGGQDFALVDEGPGLSGSSLGAVADLLEDRGVAPGRLHLFPGHAGGPGPQASARHRARWDGLPRHVLGFDALALGGRGPHRLEHWVADLTGPEEAPLRDISGGAWRALRPGHPPGQPPAHPQQERRKFLLRAGGRDWLLKFAGLGGEDARKARLGRRLAEAGLVPPVAGHRHGFLVEEWLGEAQGLDQAPRPPGALLAPVGAYLGLRARALRDEPAEGASLEALWEMACRNTALGLGEAAARALRGQAPDFDRLSRGLRRLPGDNRMQVWEWLRLPDGRLLKADALDHHAAHDLVGAQDIAWDVAGAEAELGLDPEALCASLAREAGWEPDPALVAFCRPCYLAFQLGAWTMAAESGGASPEDAALQRAEAARHGAALRRVIAAGWRTAAPLPRCPC